MIWGTAYTREYCRPMYVPVHACGDSSQSRLSRPEKAGVGVQMGKKTFTCISRIRQLQVAARPLPVHWPDLCEENANLNILGPLQTVPIHMHNLWKYFRKQTN